jgi:hypothetical protein
MGSEGEEASLIMCPRMKNSFPPMEGSAAHTHVGSLMVEHRRALAVSISAQKKMG